MSALATNQEQYIAQTLSYNKNIHDYLIDLETHFQETGEQRSLIIVRSAKLQLYLMLRIAYGDSEAWEILRQEFPVKPNPAEGEPYSDEWYFTMNKEGRRVDMRSVTMSDSRSSPNWVAHRYAIIAQDKHTQKRIHSPLGTVMDELLEAGLEELALMAAGVGMNMDSIKRQCKHNFWANLPKELTRAAKPYPGDKVTAQINEMMGEFNAAFGFKIGEAPPRLYASSEYDLFKLPYSELFASINKA